MILTLLWKFKYWIAIGILLSICIGQLAYTNHLGGKLKDADSKCIAKLQEIEQKQLKALTEKQNAINQVSADYEKAKSEQRVQVETVTRTVQKIIDRPVYNNVCFDVDGVSAINSLITSDSSEPP
ncbi:hypothetical protein [Acinetobacter sp. ANC 4173]|uniref:hypothetical protein n=1 Tax=Acinetobacter sp. ANC 4173 TaxID=2529837 RepID=UPI00103E98B9|nr:hypothetical protein [Acinetobacter sp. ANC 4173]TCB77423.1 hypothetical protein E0H94_14615 [Acinetobacter sp. ANC 4173]